MIFPIVGKTGFVRYIFGGILSGLFNFVFINIVTKVIGLILAGDMNAISNEYIVISLAVILLIVWTRRVFSLSVIHLSQTIFWKLRKDVLGLVIKASYKQFLNRKAKIRVAVLQDVYILTDASINIISFTTSMVVAISCLIYLATISIVLFFITIAIAAIGILVYNSGTRRNKRNFKISRDYENRFSENVDTILEGFKEINLEPKKGAAIFEEHITRIAVNAYGNNINAYVGFLNNQITGQVLFYILISSILLVLSIKLHIKAEDTVSFVFTLLYLLSSIQTIMVLFPSLMRARTSALYLVELKSDLEKMDMPATSDPYITLPEFREIAIKNLEFFYDASDKPFKIGPINIEVKRGDVIFIYGGNGSGKTTFMYTLLGLNTPHSGEIKLNGTIINSDAYKQYKTIFSAVFSDYYLFRELYGIDQLDVEKWNYYVHLFELDGKVKLNDKSFSTTDLSTGQKKRLALIAALLEEKPVLVLDEWAADQDPYFRKKFYTEIIPLLRKNGFTIIAITHDDKYYYCADKLYRMDFGRLVEEKRYEEVIDQ